MSSIEPVKLEELDKGIRIPREVFEIWLETWDWTVHQIGRKEFPEPFTSLGEFQLACICADPVLWVQSFLREPEDPDHKDPYGIFPYQETSMRYMAAAIHYDGAEVGKTREIIAKASYLCYTVRNGSGLVGGPLQSHLDEIIEGMDDQCTWNPDLAEARWHKRHKDGWKKHPHHAFYFTNGFKLDFKPAGDKGVAFRGVHARTFAILDEAAKLKNKPQWSEFWRSIKPGCIPWIYSVPDGDRSCDFYKLGQRAAVTADQEGTIEERLSNHEQIQGRLLASLFQQQKLRIEGQRIIHPPRIDEIFNRAGHNVSFPQTECVGNPSEKKDSGQAGMTEKETAVEESPSSFKDASAHVKKIRFKKFHWPKWVMPEPFWSPERKHFYVEQYNGEDSPEYKHNVHGIDGDPESTVFPYDQLRPCIREIPEYRCMKIMVDSTNNEVIVHGYKTEFIPGDTEPMPREAILIDTVYPKRSFFDYEILPDGSMTESDFRKLIKSFFVSVHGLKRGGADFGFAGDPTEILVKNIIGKKKRRVARLQLKHVTYDQQCQALDAMDDIYGPLESMSWGTDFGNAGSAVAHDLQGLPQYDHKNYDDRLKGFQFESTTDNIDGDGEAIVDSKDGKPVKITLKELATDHMTKRIQRLEEEFPPEPDITFLYPNHTVSYGGKHRIYKKQDDHLIDADRAETLAEILGVETEDLFA